jgi:hypothetical protein
MGASAVIVPRLGPTLSPPPVVVPGGPTSYWLGWSSFNGINAASEGFAGDGTGAILNFVARLVRGIARRVAGWGYIPHLTLSSTLKSSTRLSPLALPADLQES